MMKISVFLRLDAWGEKGDSEETKETQIIKRKQQKNPKSSFIQYFVFSGQHTNKHKIEKIHNRND